ncbi:hypothetical protein ACWD9X_33950 [Streptomyces sp. NPDC005075]
MPWPSFEVFVRIVDNEVVTASLSPREGLTPTQLRLPQNLEGLHLTIKRLWDAEGVRVIASEEPTPFRPVVMTRAVNRGVLVEGSQELPGAQVLIDLASKAVRRHDRTRRERRAEANARDDEQRRLQTLADLARKEEQIPDDRARSVSLRTVSGGLPTLGRGRR